MSYKLLKTSVVSAQNRYFKNSNVKPPKHNRVGGKGEHEQALVKTHMKAYEMKVAVNAKKHIRKRYTHAIAEVSILCRQNNTSNGPSTRARTYNNKDHMSVGDTRACALVRA